MVSDKRKTVLGGALGALVLVTVALCRAGLPERSSLMAYDPFDHPVVEYNAHPPHYQVQNYPGVTDEVQ
jgi:hypothetical protein